MLISEYNASRISAYSVDSNGTPITASRQDFMTGVLGAEGAALDPLTNDFIFSTFGGTDQVILVRGFAVPEPSIPIVIGLAAIRLARRRRQTS